MKLNEIEKWASSHPDDLSCKIFKPELLRLIRIAKEAQQLKHVYMAITDMAMPKGGYVPEEFLALAKALEGVE